MMKKPKIIVVFLLAWVIAGAVMFVGCNNTEKGSDSVSNDQIDQSNKSDIDNESDNKYPEDLYEYEEVSGGLLLTKYLGSETVITVPSVIGNKKVISTGTVFSGNVSIEQIILPDSVTYADLSGCDKLVSIKATGIKYFKDLKLSDCKSLKCLDLPGIISVETGFNVPDSLETLYLNNATGSLWVYSLAGASQLKTLVIPKIDSIYLDYNAWPWKLENVTISDNMIYYSISEQTNAPGTICCEADNRTLITNENAAYVYCSFFRVDQITVNGVLYTK